MLKIDCINSILPPNTKQIFIAYSGGVDSHVLLHLAALNEDLRSNMTAVYIHHGLQLEADAWARHCQTIALSLGVSFKEINVKIDEDSGKSLEELAREARYQALKPLLGLHDVVLLAQHREDQMETVLLQLFRGAGIQGLSGMPSTIAFGKGLMCRPLLDVSKQVIDEYAVENQLSWVEDPSNKSNEFDRNFLRNQIVPQLKEKWPALDKTIARSARHCANAQRMSEGLARELFNQVVNETDHTLNLSKLCVLETNKQSLVIRQWFKAKQLRMPSEKVVLGIINQVINAKESSTPEIKGQGYSIRRYREKLFCLKPNKILDVKNLLWSKGVQVIEINDNSKLSLFESTQGIPKGIWADAEVEVKFRQGAEKISLPGRKGRHSLKKLYQEKGIPPWQRNSIPLIYLDGHLAAVANLWISADYFSQKQAACYQIDWIMP